MTDNNLAPSNIEAEEAILGSILLDPSAINTVADILTADAFYVLAHQQIYYLNYSIVLFPPLILTATPSWF